MINESEKNAREDLYYAMKIDGYGGADIMPTCPKCTRDGGDVVRCDDSDFKWVCRDCGYKFGDGKDGKGRR